MSHYRRPEAHVPIFHRLRQIEFPDTTGTLTVPETGSSEAVPGFSPLWNADGTLLVYLSRTGASGGIRATLNVELGGTTRTVVG